MQVVITDANIFIDLYELNLLYLFFQLPYKIHTTSFVIEELSDECEEVVEQETILIRINEADRKGLEQMVWNRGFSFPDKTILYSALIYKMMVFSGEKKMKKWCQSNDIESHGILFIFQQFIDQKLLSKDNASQKLETLMKINQWLPLEICFDLLIKWRK